MKTSKKKPPFIPMLITALFSGGVGAFFTLMFPIKPFVILEFWAIYTAVFLSFKWLYEKKVLEDSA